VNSTLYRGLSRLDIVALTLNSIVGAGIFTLPAVLVAGAAGWSISVLLLAITLVAVMALCTIEVASRYDVTGGPMYYAGEAFGPSASFVVGWLYYLSRLAGFGAIATIMLDYSAGLWPALGTTAVRALGLTVFIGTIASVNVRGIVQGALTTNLLTIIKGVPLVLLAVAGLWLGGWAWLPSEGPSSLDALGGAVLVALFACMGFEPAAVIAGEARDPQRDLPVGMLGGVLGAGALYTLLLFTCFRTVPDLGRSTRPLADAAAALVGPEGATVLLLTAVISCAGSLSGWMMASPRVLYALAVQGDMPEVFAAVHPVRRTPWVAILASALLVWLMTLSGTFVYLATFSAIARLLTYASTSGALLVLRKRVGPAPIPIPLGPLLAIVAVLSTLVVLGSTTSTAVRDVSIAVVLGWAARTVTRRRNQVVVANV
jgi:amino acid transporter